MTEESATMLIMTQLNFAIQTVMEQNAQMIHHVIVNGFSKLEGYGKETTR